MTTSILEQLRVDLKQQEKLTELDQKRVALEEEDKQRLAKYAEGLDKVLSGKQKDQGELQRDVAELTKLDAGIQKGNKYTGEISDLAESLTIELTDLGQFFGDLNQYKGVERVLAKLSTKWADKSRLSRVRSSDVKQNLQTILDYGSHLVHKLYATTLENMKCQAKIDETIQMTATTLKDTQPLYEAARSEREALERKLTDIRDRFDKAGETERATIAQEREALERQVQEAKIEENEKFTIVQAARQTLPIQRVHLKAYSDMIDALIQQRTRLEQNIKNVTELYRAVPTAIATALSTKAVSRYDKGFNYSLDKSTEVVLASAAGVLDETASRNERPPIEPDKLELYRKASHEMRSEFDRRAAELKRGHATPTQTN
jgi:hypothetical protein